MDLVGALGLLLYVVYSLGWPRESYGISKSMHMIPRIPIYLPSVH